MPQKQIDTIEIRYQGNFWSLPVVEGSEGERAINIACLRADTGLITLDPGYVNTGSCTSAITFMDVECQRSPLEAESAKAGIHGLPKG